MYRTMNREMYEAHKIYEAITAFYDITERQPLLSEVHCARCLDWSRAVWIIYDLRNREPLDFFARLRDLPYGAWPTGSMSDQYICDELIWQTDCLKMKCLSKATAQLLQCFREALRQPLHGAVNLQPGWII